MSARVAALVLTAAACSSASPPAGGEAAISDAVIPEAGAISDARPPDDPAPPDVGLAADAPSQDAALPDHAAAPDAPRRPSNPSCRAPARDSLPPRLADTGCFDRGAPSHALPALIPYAVNAPLWSDGADKQRFLALPEGAQITVRPDGDWDLPAGAVLVKTFHLAGRPVETRFFARHEDGIWSGWSYAWNQQGTDATLVDGGGGRFGDWQVPSRADCDRCHTEGAGFTLGLEIGQLERLDPDGRSQLERLAALDLFAAPLPSTRHALPDPTDPSAPLEARARAYLHANCGNCHRPGAEDTGSFDARYATALADAALCGAEPRKGNLGHGTDVRLVKPSAPDQSMIVLRMRALDTSRMPTIASEVLDSAGVALIERWIAGLPGCP